jgi:hypothetical protein
MARVKVITTGVMNKAKTRVLQQESNRSRSASRSREPDSEEEQSSSKAHKPSPRSPPHLVVGEVEGEGNEEEQSSSKAQKPSPCSPPHPVVGEEEGEGKEGWPALPSPAKGGPQGPTQALGSQKASSPPKDPMGPKGPGAQPQPSTGASSPLKDSSASKGPENQLQLIHSQAAPRAEGPKSGLQKPGVSGKGPMGPLRATKPSEEDGASKGTPQKGPNSGGPNRAIKETSKPLGPHLKAPQPRPQGPLAKGDSKVATKAKQ